MFGIAFVYLLNPTCKVSKKMHAGEAAGGAKLAKLAHLSQPTTETSFGNFIYTAIVCNDTPLS